MGSAVAYLTGRSSEGQTTLSRSVGGGPHKGRCPGHHSPIKGVPCQRQSRLFVGTSSGGLLSTTQQRRANEVGSAGSGMCHPRCGADYSLRLERLTATMQAGKTRIVAGVDV